MLFIVDVQGFQYKNSDFICKEIAVLRNFTCSHVIVNAPINYDQLNQKFKHQVDWLTENCHGLRWDELGTIDYCQVQTYLRNLAADYNGAIFVKGMQKKKWLQRYLQNEVIDLEAKFSCPTRLPEILEQCAYHYGYKRRCSRDNVFKLGEWCLSNNHLS